jgi:hypothetical protein
MTFLKNLSPVAAYRDLRVFLAARRRHELWFMALSLAITLLVLFVFFKDTSMGLKKPYERNIIYVEQWPITRTDEQIKAQQKIDQAKKAILLADLKKRREAKKAEFQRLDDKLESWGF